MKGLPNYKSELTRSTTATLASKNQIVIDRQLQKKIQSLQRSVGLLSCFFFVELLAGLWIHSLSLIADAGHMLLDVMALGLTLVTTLLTHRLTVGRTVPSAHLESIAALVNGFSLLLLAVWIVMEAMFRLHDPTPDILSLPMLVTAVIGLGVNGCNVYWLHAHCHHDLNVKAAYLHVAMDAISSVGVVFAAIAMTWLNWLWADTFVSFGIAGLIVLSTVPLVVQSIHRLQGRATIGSITTSNLFCKCQTQSLEQRLEPLMYPSLEDLIQ
jgi:cobalt-zinc-cadmium efflux system protein